MKARISVIAAVAALALANQTGIAQTRGDDDISARASSSGGAPEALRVGPDNSWVVAVPIAMRWPISAAGEVGPCEVIRPKRFADITERLCKQATPTAKAIAEARTKPPAARFVEGTISQRVRLVIHPLETYIDKHLRNNDLRLVRIGERIPDLFCPMGNLNYKQTIRFDQIVELDDFIYSESVNDKGGDSKRYIENKFARDYNNAVMNSGIWPLTDVCVVDTTSLYADKSPALARLAPKAPFDDGTLIGAIRRGDISAFRERLQNKPEVALLRDPTVSGTPIEWAIAKGRLDMAEALRQTLETLPKPKNGDTWAFPAYRAAIVFHRPEMIPWIRKNGQVNLAQMDRVGAILSLSDLEKNVGSRLGKMIIDHLYMDKVGDPSVIFSGGFSNSSSPITPGKNIPALTHYALHHPRLVERCAPYATKKVVCDMLWRRILPYLDLSERQFIFNRFGSMPELNSGAILEAVRRADSDQLRVSLRFPFDREALLRWLRDVWRPSPRGFYLPGMTIPSAEEQAKEEQTQKTSRKQIVDILLASGLPADQLPDPNQPLTR